MILKEKLTYLSKKYIPISVRLKLRQLNWKLKSVFSKQEGPFYCPIIGKEYTGFPRIGGTLVSPESGAKPRHRFMWKYYLDNDILSHSISLLHIGPERCFTNKFKNLSNISYHPVDKFEDNYDYFPGVKYLDLLDLEGWEGKEFNVIICNHVFEHIPEDRLAMQNLYKLLKSDGKALISVPILEDEKKTYENSKITTAKERKKHFGQWDHVRYYGLDIVDRFKAENFNVEVINSSEYLDQTSQYFGVEDEEYLFVLTK